MPEQPAHASGATNARDARHPAGDAEATGTESRPGESTDTGMQRVVSGAALRLEEVTKRYGSSGKPAVDGLTLDIPAGEIVMFVGPSGCGKTTSLKMINRLIEPTSGTITIDGDDVRRHDVDELRRKIGYVIQGGSLFPHMTVADNIGLVPGLLKWDKKRIATRTEELLDLVGLDPARYRDRYPRELSGGQQQRVGVARGLAADPPVVLMDEPFGAVDPITRQRLQDELMRIQAELQKTIVCVTHDIDEAVKLGDRICIFSEHAQIAQYDAPAAVLSSPANEFVEDFVGAGSTLKQLSLSRVSDLELAPVTTASVGDSVEAKRREAVDKGDSSVVVLDERRRPLSWVNVKKLRGETIGGDSGYQLYTIDHRATLNDALDTMLTSSYGGALVTGRGGEFLGICWFDRVTDFIARANRELGEQSAQDVPEAQHG